MAKKKKKSQEGSKAVISIIVVVIIALFGYFCKGELPFELPFEPPSFSDTQPNPGNGTLGGLFLRMMTIFDKATAWIMTI